MGLSIGRSAPRVGFVDGVAWQDGQAVTNRRRNGERSLSRPYRNDNIR
jgi:hypothetical protein